MVSSNLQTEEKTNSHSWRQVQAFLFIHMQILSENRKCLSFYAKSKLFLKLRKWKLRYWIDYRKINYSLSLPTLKKERKKAGKKKKSSSQRIYRLFLFLFLLIVWTHHGRTGISIKIKWQRSNKNFGDQLRHVSIYSN